MSRKSILAWPAALFSFIMFILLCPVFGERRMISSSILSGPVGQVLWKYLCQYCRISLNWEKERGKKREREDRAELWHTFLIHNSWNNIGPERREAKTHTHTYICVNSHHPGHILITDKTVAHFSVVFRCILKWNICVNVCVIKRSSRKAQVLG